MKVPVLLKKNTFWNGFSMVVNYTSLIMLEINETSHNDEEYFHFGEMVKLGAFCTSKDNLYDK